jgi:multidrug transporter EmrE-like cation transporter
MMDTDTNHNVTILDDSEIGIDLSLDKKAELSTSSWGIVLMILCTLFTSLGQVLWKFGLIEIDFNNLITLLNIPFMLGFVSYAASAILMLKAFGKGELSILYPIMATSYVWVSLVSPLLFSADSMNLLKWLGVGTIVLSVSLLGLGNSIKNGRNRNNG